ncbi:MAG: winged helix-turn-helix domain-containing protein [Thermoplasmatota archaeon]|nr:winged helix-turn-helix domain-containing protein [Candidatus Thermoplasmatota archaeon]MBU1914877.1 winged helix-turn-helix domain-containing protein [Candidatus Thermoplasmatota archaeon]
MDAFEMFRLLLDEYSSQIIELTQPKALNAVDLSGMLGIPIAACYRRIRALRDAGILKEEGRAVSIGGKLVATYRSSVDTAEVMLKDGRLKVLISTNGRRSSDEVVLSDEPPSMLHWSNRNDPQA